MIPTDPDLFDALADCVAAGDTLFEALEKVASAGGATASWAHRVRQAMRSEIPAARALRESNLLAEDELWLVSNDEAATVVASTLHAVALRRRRVAARRRAVLWGLAAPFGLAWLTVVIDPLPNLIGGGDYVWPATRGFLVLLVLSIAVVLGVPALLRSPRALRSCTAVPGLGRLAALFAEEELTTALAPFIDGGEVRATGFTVAASFLSWSPLGDALRVPAPAVSLSSGSGPLGGLAPLAGRLSLGTHLAVVRGVASKRLGERLAERRDFIAALLTTRLRLVTRTVAYTLVVLYSIISVVGMISRGLPAMSLSPGGATSPDEKQLEDLLKQLE